MITLPIYQLSAILFSQAPQQQALNQLAAIPFENLIGGPLVAAVEAQAKAAQSTLGFIETVAFDEDGDVRNITFQYRGGEAGAETMELVVPILTIVPIPYIRIEDMTINFKANISASTEIEQKEEETRTTQSKLSGNARYLFYNAKLSGKVSSKSDSTSTQNSKYSVEYTIDIYIHAVQDDMPAGMAKVLNILTESIERQAEATTGGNGDSDDEEQD